MTKIIKKTIKKTIKKGGAPKKSTTKKESASYLMLNLYN